MATVTRENIGLLTDKITVNVAKGDYLPSFEKALKNYGKQANIPGFRKGMVPAGLIKKMYGSSVFTDEVLRTVEKELTTYMTNEKLEIFAQPLPLPENDARQIDMSRPDDYSFAFEVGLKPAFNLADLGTARLTRYKVEVTPAMIDEEVEAPQCRDLAKIGAALLHAQARVFERGERAVPFVEVEDAWSNAHGLQRAEATDAQEELLADTGTCIAAVEARTEVQVFGCIARDFGVEQEKITTPDLDAPDLGSNGAAACLDFDHHGFPVLADGKFHGELGHIGLKIFFLLPAVLIQALEEVAFAVEQADADEGNTEVGGTLDVVSGENAQAAGINGEGFVQAKLRGKVGHGMGAEDTCVHGAPGAVGS